MAQKDTEQKKARKDAFLKLGLILIGLLLAVDTFQISRFGAIVERVDQYNQGVVDELGNFRQDISLFGNDMNEMRSFLLMPAHDYSFLEKDTDLSSAAEKKTSVAEQAIYQLLGDYISEKKAQENSKKTEETVNAIYNDAAFAPKLAELKLKAEKPEISEPLALIRVRTEDNKDLFVIKGDKKTAENSIESSLGLDKLTEASTASVIEFITAQKDNAVQKREQISQKKQMLVDLLNSAEVKNAASDKKITANPTPEEDPANISFSFANSDGTKLLAVAIAKKDLSIEIDGQNADESTLKQSLIDSIKNLDTTTQVEKVVRERQMEFESLFAQTAFKDMLQTAGLTVETKPRMEANKIIYDVKDSTGKAVFSFVIEQSSGYLKLLKDNQETDFNSLIQDGSKKKS